MKKILTILLSLMIVITPIISFAQEENTDLKEETNLEETVNQNISIQEEEIKQTEPPQQPNIEENMDADSANKMIDNYNDEVDNYNKYVDDENNRREEEYNKNVKEVDTHNEQEKQKEEENNKALEAQEKLQQEIAADSQSKVTNQTTKADDLPDSWIDDKQEPTLIDVKKHDSDKQYKIMNMHIYLKEGIDSYDSAFVTDENITIDDTVKNNMILAEWETISAGGQDILTIYSQAHSYPNKGAAFVRKLEGYTNGYWIPSQTLITSAVNEYQDWDNEPIQILSYNEGDWYYDTPKNVLNLYTYIFMRAGKEPEKVEKYQPDYWVYPNEIEYLQHLSKLNRIEKQEKDKEKTEEEKKPKKEEKSPKKEKKDPKKEEAKEEKQNSKKEKIKEKKSEEKDSKKEQIKKEETKAQNKETVKQEKEKKKINNNEKDNQIKEAIVQNKDSVQNSFLKPASKEALAKTSDCLINESVIKSVCISMIICFVTVFGFMAFFKSGRKK